MARTQAKILASIWTDPDWLQLGGWSRLLYLALLSQPRLSLAGHLDVMPGRWATFIDPDADECIVKVCLDDLSDLRFVVVDADELVVRSFTRHDLAVGAVNANLVKGFWSAWSGIRSGTLRKVVVDNLPDSIWAREGVTPPDQANKLRSKPRLELPLEPRFNPRSEPSVVLLTANCSLNPVVLNPDNPGSNSQTLELPAAHVVASLPKLTGKPLEQAAARSLLRYSNLAAAERDAYNPSGLAVTIRKDAPIDGTLATLTAWIADGMEPDAAADKLAGDSVVAKADDPAVVAAVRDAAKLREADTYAALDAGRTSGRGDHRAGIEAARKAMTRG